MNPDIPKEEYDDGGGASDYRRLYAIFMIFVDDCSGWLPLHLRFLPQTLKDANAVKRHKPKFMAFITSHPCLLTHVERLMLYILVDKFLFRFLKLGNSQQVQNVETRLTNLGSKGWVNTLKVFPILREHTVMVLKTTLQPQVKLMVLLQCLVLKKSLQP